MAISREDCISLDRQDPLREYRDRFQIPEDLIYLDGNSLGALPKHTPQNLSRVIEREWGEDLIRSWNTAGWFELPGLIGDRIGNLVGAAPGQIVVCDNTSVNIFKTLHAALALNPGRNRIVADRGDFPTDLYMVEGAARSAGRDVEVVLIDAEHDVMTAFDDSCAVVLLSEVNYRTGFRLDMAGITAAAHRLGIIVIWDLCHSAGAMPIALDHCEADFAVGCTYKFLNGGPGAPAFVYAAERHHGRLTQPLQGWWSHQSPFAFETGFQPASGIKTMLTGTQPIISLQGVAGGLDTFDGVDLEQLRDKSVQICSVFSELVLEKCGPHGVSLCGPEDPDKRGSHVAFHFEHGFAVVQAMIAQGVIGDFRAPDLMRFGFAPLYLSFEQAFDAATIMQRCIEAEVWEDSRFQKVGAVT